MSATTAIVLVIALLCLTTLTLAGYGNDIASLLGVGVAVAFFAFLFFGMV